MAQQPFSSDSGFSTTGNVTADYILGNGSQLTGVTSSLSGNLAGNLEGNGYGANALSFVSTTGNVTSGNILTTGRISATGNIISNSQIQSSAFTGGNISWSVANQTDFQGAIKVGGTGVIKGPGGASSITLNNNGANIPILGVTNTGNSTSTSTGALIVSGGAGVAGNVYAGNVYTAGLISATGNTTTGNLLTAGLISATGNITTAGSFVGNGVGLTNVTVSVAGNIVGTSTNVSLVAGSYTSTFDNTGVATFPGTVYSNALTNGTAFAVGNGAVSNCALSMTPTAGTAGNYAIRDYSTADSVMFFDTTIGSANTGGSFQFRGSNAFTTYATVNQYGVSQPTLPAFRVYGNGVTTGLTITTNGNGVLTGNNWAVDYNQGSYLNSTTGAFTAPVAGLYQVNLTARCANNAAPTAQVMVVKNYGSANTVQAMWEVAANTTVNHFGVSTVSKLAVGDTLAVRVTVGSINFDSNDNWSVAFLG